MKQVFLRFAEGYKAVIERNEMLERELVEIKQMLTEQSQVKLALEEVAASSQQSVVDLKDTLTTEVARLREELATRDVDSKAQIERLNSALNSVTKQNESLKNVMSDRDKALMETIRTMQEETRKKIAAATEEQKKRKKFLGLF
ncbi:DUF3967 domain-containing protein [Alicyclobacillus fastidiosus]|uniref:DUF3967 domain-containing protein n=1 Tax=Alicyclobacillus fastidiosus TaxID=392011 RepID=UPI0023E9006B|nr:DUF3967 domain-containing protein [Alicyclobacillus fastidiosus]GMA66119.1 hypothetical protein GCM10025859_65610 [Alicyclobacillus fastidiosus]